MQTKKRTGLIFAMFEEQEGLQAQLKHITKTTIAGREFIEAQLHQHTVVCVLAGIGKVAASITATTLINEFNVDQIIMCGVAGGAQNSLKQGDIVIARQLLQHDMDASPLFPRFEIPLKAKTRFDTDTHLRQELRLAIENFLRTTPSTHQTSRLYEGLIASGDQFISDSSVISALCKALPDLLAVEMEGAAIAQICDDFKLPYAVIRTISDNANEEAQIDFQSFIKGTAAPYTLGILDQYFQALAA